MALWDAEWVRVKDKSTGHEYSVAVVDPDAHEVLKKDAADMYNEPLPAKPKLTTEQAKAAKEGS